MERRITLPLTEELAKTLKAGDSVLVTGTIYTSRDAGHKRMCEALARGEELPFDPTDATIYYVGPTPAKPGQVIGVRERSKSLEVIQNSLAGFNHSKYPWLEWSESDMAGKFLSVPERSEIPENIKEQLIVELYSKN